MPYAYVTVLSTGRSLVSKKFFSRSQLKTGWPPLVYITLKNSTFLTNVRLTCLKPIVPFWARWWPVCNGLHSSKWFLQQCTSDIRVQYSQYTHIYTGSSTATTKASCGVCVEYISKRCAITFNKFASSFNSELCTILYALYCLLAYTFFKAYSSSALKPLLQGTARNTALQTKYFF